MRKIAVLDQTTIDKIAAGEVVERPSSVVKELTENAIDAGATAITVEIKDGGKSLIRITDNGAGMEREQVPLAFLRHATSKIECVEDLQTISSLGFRGEALSSIAAVSQVELITKTQREMSGTRYLIEGGKEQLLEEIGAPEGTTFLVRNLFFNTPARSKFLKTDATEGSYISSLMEQLALSHSEISFKYIQNGQVKLHSSGNYHPKDVIYQIYGREITRELLEVRFENEFLQIDGFVGRPQLSRGNRSFENYYINGRYVKDKIITRAIEDAYKGFVMQHKFPFAVLQIRMEGNDLDVNVHPAKREVRFSRGEDVYQAVYRAVLSALREKELIPKIHIEKEAPPKKELPKKEQIPEPFEEKRKNALLRESVAYPNEQKKPKEPKESKESKEPAVSPPPPSTEKPLPKPPQKPDAGTQMDLFENRMLSLEARKKHRLIGQIFDTYWLVQYGEEFYIIDQHAAHEKVLYERLTADYRRQNIASQYVSPPIIVSLNLQEEEALRAHRELFETFGFEIEQFGGREYSICAVPQNLIGMTGSAFFRELLDGLHEENGQREPFDLFAGRLAIMACKAAVKGGSSLSFAEAEALIDELLHLENPYHCPHGRPTIVSMSKRELEKKFKRIL